MVDVGPIGRRWADVGPTIGTALFRITGPLWQAGRLKSREREISRDFVCFLGRALQMMHAGLFLVPIGPILTELWPFSFISFLGVSRKCYHGIL